MEQDQIDPQRVLQIAQELDPILIERSILRAVNEKQSTLIESLQQRLSSESETGTSDAEVDTE